MPFKITKWLRLERQSRRAQEEAARSKQRKDQKDAKAHPKVKTSPKVDAHKGWPDQPQGLGSLVDELIAKRRRGTHRMRTQSD